MIHNKSKMKWRKYLCRKDFVRREFSIQKGLKKKCRKIGNQDVRLFKGDISDGGNYKKISDVQYAIF